MVSETRAMGVETMRDSIHKILMSTPFEPCCDDCHYSASVVKYECGCIDIAQKWVCPECDTFIQRNSSLAACRADYYDMPYIIGDDIAPEYNHTYLDTPCLKYEDDE